MAVVLQLQQSYLRVSVEAPWPWRCALSNYSNNTNFLLIRKKKKVLIRRRRRRSDYSCCCCSSISSPHNQQLEDDGDQLEGKYGKNEGQFGQLVNEYGWQVRRMCEEDDEMRNVANIQAQAFHQPLFFFDNLFFDFFQAEVLSGLLYRLRNSPADRYACLVAEANIRKDEDEPKLVGVVDVTVFRDEAVLAHLNGADEYLYVSGIAVLRSFRRKKIATVLLKACEMLAVIWRYKYLVLRAYEDDWGAQKLYTNAGYRIVSRDPLWTSTWIGRKRRVLMIKLSSNMMK